MPPQFGNAMQVDSEAANSSEDLSSPPASPPQNQNSSSLQDTIHVAPRASSGAHSTNPIQPPSTAANGDAPAPKPKRVRKPREPKVESDAPPKVRKPRKPREPKVKPEDGPTVSTNTTPASSRKRQPKEEPQPQSQPQPQSSDTPTGLRQSTIQFQHSNAPVTETPTQPQIMPPRPPLINSNSLPPPSTTVPTPRPHSSGQNYDPIRGATITTNISHSAQASPRINRASASPSITSLIDPPLATKPSAPVTTFSPQVPIQPSPSAPPTTTIASPPAQPPKPTPPPVNEAMDIDPVREAPAPPPPEIKLQSKSSSSGPTPKPTRPASPPPVAPMGTGSGLLSSSDLFGGPSMNSGGERKGIDIELHLPLNLAGGNTINIAQEIAKKYGRDAINPRAAEHRQRLLQVAAAANKIDGGSGADDMSVDLMSDFDGDSNVEMGGMGDDLKSTGADNTDGGQKPRKRRKKVEEYDKDDDFIDDTELAWQEQAAVAKDGFFVYSGPLITEAQAASVESSTAPARGSRGGRGRGRGRGGAAGAATSSSTSHAATLAEKTKDSNSTNGNTPATGRGSRGGRARGTGAPRKPRITKADRERMEAEKVDRERQAAGTGGGPAQATPAQSNTNGSAPTAQVSAGSNQSPLATAQTMATSTQASPTAATQHQYQPPLAPQHSQVPLQIQPQPPSSLTQTMYGPGSSRVQI